MAKLKSNIAVTVTMPQDWKEAAQKLAKKNGLSLSELVRDLIRQQLPEEAVNELSKPQKQGRQMERRTWHVKSVSILQGLKKALRPWDIALVDHSAVPDILYEPDDLVFGVTTPMIDGHYTATLHIPFGDSRMSGSVNQCVEWIAAELREQVLAGSQACQ
jgi:hypothetical protein